MTLCFQLVVLEDKQFNKIYHFKQNEDRSIDLTFVGRWFGCRSHDLLGGLPGASTDRALLLLLFLRLKLTQVPLRFLEVLVRGDLKFRAKLFSFYSIKFSLLEN